MTWKKWCWDNQYNNDAKGQTTDKSERLLKIDNGVTERPSCRVIYVYVHVRICI